MLNSCAHSSRFFTGVQNERNCKWLIVKQEQVSYLFLRNISYSFLPSHFSIFSKNLYDLSFFEVKTNRILLDI
jgi:hypothetical protein